MDIDNVVFISINQKCTGNDLTDMSERSLIADNDFTSPSYYEPCRPPPAAVRLLLVSDRHQLSAASSEFRFYAKVSCSHRRLAERFIISSPHSRATGSNDVRVDYTRTVLCCVLACWFSFGFLCTCVFECFFLN